jgi:DNA-binding transcriptional LysR family regulator
VTVAVGLFLRVRFWQRGIEAWCPPFPGFFLYYPRQRQLQAALAALIETLRFRPEKDTTPW